MQIYIVFLAVSLPRKTTTWNTCLHSQANPRTQPHDHAFVNLADFLSEWQCLNCKGLSCVGLGKVRVKQLYLNTTTQIDKCYIPTGRVHGLLAVYYLVVSTHAALVWFSYMLLSDICFKNLNEKSKVDTGVFSNYLSVP